MVSIAEFKKRRKAAFMKEVIKLAGKYNKNINNHISTKYTQFANECFNLVNDYTCDCTKEKQK